MIRYLGIGPKILHVGTGQSIALNAPVTPPMLGGVKPANVLMNKGLIMIRGRILNNWTVDDH